MSELREILVVEDEQVVLEAARRILAGEGIGVDLAADGGRAAEALRQHPYRVVLCDLMLPGSSGFTLLEQSRPSPATQFVVITGFATLENAIESFRRGAFDFLPKPFEADELLGVVRRALCYHDLVAAGALAAAAEEPPATGRPAVGERLALGHHCWAALDPDGSATVGLGEAFSAVIDELEAISLPAPGDVAAQGRRLARLHSRDGRVHRVWAPLSGQIIAVNDRLSTTPDLALREPLDAGWLVGLVPSRLDDEFAGLVRRTAPRARPARDSGGD